MKRFFQILFVLFLITPLFITQVFAAVAGGVGSGTVESVFNKTGTNSFNSPSDLEEQWEIYNNYGTNFPGTMANGMSSGIGAVAAMITGTRNENVTQATAVGFFTKSIATLYEHKPASGTEYVAYLKQSIRPLGAEPAYAAGSGIGYQQLNPILAVWTVSRNLAYLLLSVVFVIIAFMIIFRIKIDPKTVITLQATLPKIFLSFILITFSYAIAGFVIDIMYILISFAVGITKTITINNATVDVSDISNQLPTGTIFDIFGAKRFFDAAGSSSAAVGEVVASLLDSNKGAGGNFFGFGASVIAWVVIAAGILYALFKTWLALLNAYIQIILGVITAPIVLAFNAIPGRDTFGTWLRTMLANTLVFPFVVLMLLVGYALTQSWNSSQGFVPPLLGGNSPGAVQGLIGLAVIWTMPKAISILQETLKAPPWKFGTAWAESLQGGVGLLNAGAQQTGIPQARQYYNQLQTQQRIAEIVRKDDPGQKAGILTNLRYWAARAGTGPKVSPETLRTAPPTSQHASTVSGGNQGAA